MCPDFGKLGYLRIYFKKLKIKSNQKQQKLHTKKRYEFRHVFNTAMKPFLKHASKTNWLSVSQILQLQSGPKRDFPLTKRSKHNVLFVLGFFFVLGLFCSAVEPTQKQGREGVSAREVKIRS